MGLAGLDKIGNEKKWVFKLNIVVDVVGQYIPNGSGGRGRRVGGVRRSTNDGRSMLDT